MSPSEVFWRVFEGTGRVGTFLLYRICLESGSGDEGEQSAEITEMSQTPAEDLREEGAS